MALRPEDLPHDPAGLIEMVLAFDGENESLRSEIAMLKTLVFGTRSERAAVICSEQLALDLGNESTVAPSPANDDDPASHTTKRRKARRNIGALPAHLP